MIKKSISFIINNIFHHKNIQIFNFLKKRKVNNFLKDHSYQIGKLRMVLDVAFASIPYYEKYKFNTNVFTYSDFIKIPILTKEIIRNKTEFLINPNFNNMKGVRKNSSGGSTGEPVTFFQTKEQNHHGSANYYLALNRNGINIYDVSVNLWGAERDMYNTSKKFNIRAILHNKITLNSFVLSDSILKNYVIQLNLIKPKYIIAYVHSIYEMAKFINQNNIIIEFTPIIHCTTGPLYPEMKTEIRKAFNNGHVYNFYGSREVSAIATEIKDQKDMFVLYDNVFIEILDKNNNPVKKGEEGEIVVTTLNNFYMPLLRYKIGDRAIKGDDLEFGTLKLETVVGRTLGVIHKKDGSKIDGQFFTTLFFNKRGIKNFQLIQITISELELKIIKSETYSENELSSILTRIRKELIDVKINVIFCDTIDLSASGKKMYVYSML